MSWPGSRDGCHSARCCRRPQLPVPGWVLVHFDAHLFFFFCKVKGDDGCRMQTSTVRPCVTVPPMTPRGSVLRAPASRPHPRSMTVLKPETLCSVWWARIRALTCSLLVMWVSLGEWMCRILSRQRTEALAFMFWVFVPACVHFKRRNTEEQVMLRADVPVLCSLR